LEKLDATVQQKRAIGHFYNKALADLPQLRLPVPATDYAENIYWVYGVVLEDSCPFDAAAVMEKLAAEGVGSRPFFWPMHEQPVLEKMGLAGNESYPVAECLARRGLYLPSGLGTGEDDLAKVAEVVRKILQ
jgi:perosamine synthetase